MKTRSRLNFLTSVCISGLLWSNLSYAQFQKYKSKTRFNADAQNTNESEEFSEPPMEEDYSIVEREDVSAAVSNNDDDTTSEESTFGSRPSKAISQTTKNSQFVNLNPETAFGPEIVTSFDFPDTDILDLTKHMQSLTGINLILDKDVKGKVSITAPTPITVGDAWKAYLAALNMAGYTITKSGAFYKVVNARDIRYVPTKIYTGSYTPETEAHIMKVMSLKNVDAEEITRNFRPFMSRYGRIIDIKQTNTIIIADTGSNIARLEKLIKFLDVPGYEETLQIIPVKNSSAQEIAKLLDEILKSQAGGAASRSRNASAGSARFGSSGSSKSSNISKIIAEPRTNSIIAMANAVGAQQLRDLIQKLDVKLVSSSSGRVHVHYLNYGNAEDLAKTLSSLVTGSSAAKSSAANAANRRFTAGDSDNAIFNDEVKVTADKNNNALVVTASPTDWLTLKNVIGKLDIPRDQVYVEGMIMETSITKVRSYGVEYFGAYGTGSAQRGGFLDSTNGQLFNLIGNNPTGLNGLFIGGGSGGTVEIPNPVGGSPLKVNSVNGLIKAISTNSATNVLATPQILAMDNTEAEFEVGETVPVQNQITNTNGTTANNTTNQEAKLSLKITPQINKVTRFVKLKINQAINEFQAAEPGVNGRPTTTRSAVTEVMVRDKDTIAMGGLLRDREEQSLNKVPLLGDIPVLGWLFKSKSTKVQKVNLLMFLTPKIISPYQSEAALNSLEVIENRKEHISEVLDKGEKDPYSKRIDKIAERVNKQKQGPLFNTTPNQFQKTNESTEGISNSNDKMEDVNYQNILDESQGE